jgi:uncharacterized protein (DUF58 family)
VNAVQGEHRRSHWRRFSEAMAASSSWSQAAVSGQRHVGAAQARHTQDPAAGHHHRQLIHPSLAQLVEIKLSILV